MFIEIDVFHETTFLKFLASILARPYMQIGIIWKFMQPTTPRDWHRILKVGLKLSGMFS